MRKLEGPAAFWKDSGWGSSQEHDSESAVLAMVDQYSDMLNRVARSVTRDFADAEDVVQETFLRVLRHHNKLGELRDPRTWLIRITWNLALDRKRRARSRPPADNLDDWGRVLSTEQPSAEDVVITAQRHAQILKHVDTLPAKEREVFLLSAVNDLSSVEIALLFKTTESTIRSCLYRARHALAALLEHESCLRRRERPCRPALEIATKGVSGSTVE